MECLNNIIGVTTTENTCILEGLTVEQKERLKKSTSGLYLDEVPGGVHMKALKDADASKALYPLTTGAIATATKTMEDDLVLKLNQQYQKNRPNFVGNVGRMSFAQSLPAGVRYRGICLKPIDVSDAVVTLTRITIILNVSAAVNVMLLKVPFESPMGVEVAAWTVNTVANSYVSVYVNQGAGGLKLPLVENGQAVEYWLVYDALTTGGVPKDTKIECSTCGKSGGPRLTDYLDANGVEFGDMNNLHTAYKSEYSQGLVLDLEVKCDNERLFCREYKADDAVAVTMAWGVLFKAAELLIEAVLQSPDINRFTTQNREYLWGKRNHFKAQYEERITFLAAAIDVSASNCYVCRAQENQPFVQTIFS
jgi:hypothetical protein